MNGRKFPELNAMLAEVLPSIAGPFGPAHPDEQLERNRQIQLALIAKCLEAGEELIPDLVDVFSSDTEEPEVVAACGEFALAAGEQKWPGIVELLRRLGNDEATFWKRAKRAAA